MFFPRLRIPTPIRRLTRRHEPRIHAKRLGSYEEARNHAEKSVIMQMGRVMQRDEELQETVQSGEGSCKEAINHVEKQESFREERNHAERRKITHRGEESCKEARSHAKRREIMQRGKTGLVYFRRDVIRIGIRGSGAVGGCCRD